MHCEFYQGNCLASGAFVSCILRSIDIGCVRELRIGCGTHPYRGQDQKADPQPEGAAFAFYSHSLRTRHSLLIRSARSRLRRNGVYHAAEIVHRPQGLRHASGH